MFPSTQQRIAITGGAGVLGRAVADRLIASDTIIRGIGRSNAPAGFIAEWRRADLLEPASISGALDGIDTIVHCASSPRDPQKDRIALTNLIETARLSHARIVYVSICGIEGAAQHLEYYRIKLAGEAQLIASDVPWTIVRISQFHPFAAFLLSQLVVGPFLLRPRITLQPVDIGFAAEQLCQYVLAGAAGRTPDIHGPERLNAHDLIAPWLSAMQLRKIMLPIPSFGRLKAFGSLNPAQGFSGGTTWTQWLASPNARNNPYDARSEQK